MKGNPCEFVAPSALLTMENLYVGFRIWNIGSFSPMHIFMQGVEKPKNEPGSRPIFRVLKSFSSDTWIPNQPMRAVEPLHENIYDKSSTKMRGLCTPFKQLGVFAYRTYPDALVSIHSHLSYANMYHSVLDKKAAGLIAMWGEVLVHEKGLRSSFAYPLLLCDRDLAERYNTLYFPWSPDAALVEPLVRHLELHHAAPKTLKF